MSNVKDIIGQRFGRLVVISRAENTKEKRARWNCLCDCGSTATVSGYCLRHSHTKSCGCLQKETIKNIRKTHGLCETPTYMSWAYMKSRCLNKNDTGFHNYGGRGITVCKRWFKFENFLEDMGKKPDNMMLERVNNDSGYSPDNCIWASRDDQNNNKRNNKYITYQGITLTRTQWSIKLGGSQWLVRNRIRDGWSESRAVTTPPLYNCL